MGTAASLVEGRSSFNDVEASESYSASSDAKGIVRLYDDWNGKEWGNSSGWRTAAKMSSWYGVTISRATPRDAGMCGRIIGLEMRNNGLQGEIPRHLGKLKQLRWLLLGDNPGLVGHIPHELGLLLELRQLDFHNCVNIHGEIPNELGSLSQLKQLSLHGCKDLIGSIPVSFENLSSLEELDLFNCVGLTGRMPEGLGRLMRLSRLVLISGQVCSVNSETLDDGNLIETPTGYFACEILRTSTHCVTYDPAEVAERAAKARQV